jgi:chromosome partitioning protein
MKIVIAQHKGGVGKTTLATHIAGTLSENILETTLLMDCDTQADSFRFFTNCKPSNPLETKTGKNKIQVLWNPKREKLSTKHSFDEYDNIVVDINTRFQDALQIIIELVPDLILIPIDRQLLSVDNMKSVLLGINTVTGIVAYKAPVKIIQMGSTHDLEEIFKELEKITDTKYFQYHIPYLDKEFNEAIYNCYYIWEVKNYSFLKNKFKEMYNND